MRGLDQLADALAAGLGGGADRRALIRLALDFWTWRRLSREGLDDETAADLMTTAAANAAPMSRERLSRRSRAR